MNEPTEGEIVGEAKRREESTEENVGPPERRSTPFFEKLLDDEAKEIVHIALASMGILANRQDNFQAALSVVRSVAAVRAAQLAPEDRVPFYKNVGKYAAQQLVSNEQAPRIVVPR